MIDRPGKELAETILAWLSDGVPMTAPPEVPTKPEPVVGNREINALWVTSQAAGVTGEGLIHLINEMLGTSYGSSSDMKGVMTISQAEQVLTHLKGLSQAAG